MFRRKQREIDRLNNAVVFLEKIKGNCFKTIENIKADLKNKEQIIEHRDQTINDYLAKIVKLEEELKLAKDLSNILNQLAKRVSGIEEQLKLIKAEQQTINERDEEIIKLKEELKQAKDLSNILNQLAQSVSESNEFISIARYSPTGNLQVDLVDLPDNYLQYVDDILGGKVIKQDGTKCLVITKDGEVKTGLTKSKPDKGYSYKLVRE